VPPTARSKALMHLRRFRHWLGGFSWWAVFALVFALAGVALAASDQSQRLVLAVGLAAVTLALLAQKE
jgi:hypothetical protein